MIVEISTDIFPYDVVISCDKPGVITATPNVPITMVVDVKKDGIDGKSAYELALEKDSNIGTEADWLNSIQFNWNSTNW